MKSFVVIVVGLGLALTLRAADAQPSPPGPSAAADAALAEGRKAYDVREWDLAISKFKEAYKLRPDAASLFNLAQSYRLKGDCGEAAAFYKTYKRNYPTAPNIDKIEKFIVEMDTCVKAGVKPPDPTPPVTTPPVTTPPVTTPPVTTPVTTPPSVVPPPPPPPRPTSNRTFLKWPGIAGLGVGAIGIGVGIKFALDGKGFNDDLKSLCAVSCTGAQATAIEADGESANKKAVIFTAIGGGVLVTGAVLFVLSFTGGQSSEANVAIVPTTGGASATYSLEF